MSETILGLMLDARRAKKQGSAALEERQRARLAEIVAFARANSPFYRDIYRGLPGRIEDPTVLPATSKKELMERFDDWVTDREATIEKARSFVGNPGLIGERFLGKYTVATTSGVTGTRGIFVLDERNVTVNQALTLRMMRTFLDTDELIKIVARGGVTAW